MIGLTLLKQQLSSKKLGFIIWIIVWSLLLLLFANVFNSFSKDAAQNAKLFEQLPQGIFNAINIDPSVYLTKIEIYFWAVLVCLSTSRLNICLLPGSWSDWPKNRNWNDRYTAYQTNFTRKAIPCTVPRLSTVFDCSRCGYWQLWLDYL